MKRFILLLLALFFVSCGIKPQKAQLILEQNASTGHTWEVIQSQELFQIEEKSIEAQNQMVGVPSQVQFTLIPQKSGETTVEFIYKQPWQESKEDLHLIYKLEVDSNKQIHIKDKKSKPSRRFEKVDLKIE